MGLQTGNLWKTTSKVYHTAKIFNGTLRLPLPSITALWLAPEQIRILTVSEKFGDYGSAVLSKLQASGLRASLDNRSEKIGAKIREGRLDLVPYLAVVGAKEAENDSVALRSRKDGELGEVNGDAVIEKLNEEVKERRL